MSSEEKRWLLKSMASERVREILAHLPMDDVTRLITGVPERQQEILSDLKPAIADEGLKNFQYPKKSAGRLMTEKFVTVSPGMQAPAALKHLRQIHRDAETFTDL